MGTRYRFAQASVGATLGNMAATLSCVGQHARAVDCARAGATVMANALGEVHPNTKHARAKVDRVEGNQLRAAGKPAEAALLLERALAFWEGDPRWGPASKGEWVVGTREELRTCRALV